MKANNQFIITYRDWLGDPSGLKATLVWALLWLPGVAAGQPAAGPGAPPDSYLTQAARSNPELEAQYQQYLAALEQVPQVRALPDPELSFGYFISSIETRVGPQQARFGVTQMFPWFGTLGARGDVAAQKAQARFEAFQESRNKLFFKVHKVWYKLYSIQQSIRITKENIEILETFESLATSRYETAQVSQADILRVQIEKEDLKNHRDRLKDDYRVASRQFRELLNYSPSPPITLPDTLQSEQLALSVAELEKAVQQQNPQLEQLDHQQESARFTIEVARKEGFPKFGLGLDYIVTGNRAMTVTDNGRDAILARGGIQIPLYRGKYRAKKRQARIELRSLQSRQTATKNRLQTKLEQALRDYYDARRRLTLYEDIQIQRTRQVIDILTEEYANGDTGFEELLHLQRKLLEYQLAREKAIVANNTAVANIEYLYGKHNVKPEVVTINQD